MQIALYDDRLEITSPGYLLNGVSIVKMKEGYSKIRNRAIASAFNYMKIVEKWGSGIPRMFDEFRVYGLREPELIDFDGDFRVNLYRNSTIHDTIQNTIQDDIKLTTNDTAILNEIIAKPTITQVELSEKLQWTIEKVKYYTKKLKDRGVLRRIGTSQKGNWKVIRK